MTWGPVFGSVPPDPKRGSYFGGYPIYMRKEGGGSYFGFLVRGAGGVVLFLGRQFTTMLASRYVCLGNGVGRFFLELGEMVG